MSAIEETFHAVVHRSSSSGIIRTIPLNNNFVERQIDVMADDIREMLLLKLKNQQFYLQLDKLSLPRNEALLLGNVRFIKIRKKLCQKYCL